MIKIFILTVCLFLLFLCRNSITREQFLINSLNLIHCLCFCGPVTEIGLSNGTAEFGSSLPDSVSEILHFYKSQMKSKLIVIYHQKDSEIYFLFQKSTVHYVEVLFLFIAGYNNLEVAEFLLDHGADVNAQDKGGLIPLHNASSYGHLDIAALLIKFNTVVNATDKWGFTPLHEAAQKGRTQLCALLVNYMYNMILINFCTNVTQWFVLDPTST